MSKIAIDMQKALGAEASLETPENKVVLACICLQKAAELLEDVEADKAAELITVVMESVNVC